MFETQGSVTCSMERLGHYIWLMASLVLNREKTPSTHQHHSGGVWVCVCGGGQMTKKGVFTGSQLPFVCVNMSKCRQPQNYPVPARQRSRTEAILLALPITSKSAIFIGQ